MSGGGGGETQTNDPWSGQQPYLQDLFSQARGLFDSGIGQNYYPGQTVADFSPYSMQGMDMLMQRGMQGSPQQDAMGNYLTQAMGQQQIDPAMMAQGGYGAMQGIGPGQQMMQQAGSPMSFGRAGGMAGIGGGINEAQLRGTAGGAYLGSNPYLDSMFNAAASRVNENFNENVMPGMAAQFGSAGRTGSDAQALMMGRAAGENQDAVSQLAANIYAPAYESERDRQLQAANYGASADINRRGMAGDWYQGGLNRQLQAGQGLGQLGMQGIGSMNDLFGNISEQQFRAGTLAPQFRDMQYGDIEQLMRVGGMTENQSQRYIDAEKQRFDFYQQAPGQALGQYGNIVQGMPGGYGTQTTSGSQGSRWGGAAGGAMTGYQMAGPWGAAAGGLLGFL